jgi:hypothetical protein
MKTFNLLVLIAALLFCATANAQTVPNKKLPAPVKSSFASKFPSAINLKWEKERNGNYEAKFSMDRINRRAEFDKNGTWIETERLINTSEVPKAVSDAVKKANPSCKLNDAEEIQTADKGMLYEVGCKTGQAKQEYRISPDGKVEAKTERK